MNLRRPFRFSLRRLLLVVAVVCILLGWKMNQVHRQRSAVEAILAHRGRVNYDYQFDEATGKLDFSAKPSSRRYWFGSVQDAYFAGVVKVDDSLQRFSGGEPAEPAWLRKLAGDDFFAHVVFAEVRGDSFTDASPLADLPHLMTVSLNSSGVTDLRPLAELEQLTVLRLSRTGVSDLSPLANLPNLRILVINNTPASYEEVEELQRALPNLKIIR